MCDSIHLNCKLLLDSASLLLSVGAGAGTVGKREAGSSFLSPKPGCLNVGHPQFPELISVSLIPAVSTN